MGRGWRTFECTYPNLGNYRRNVFFCAHGISEQKNGVLKFLTVIINYYNYWTTYYNKAILEECGNEKNREAAEADIKMPYTSGIQPGVRVNLGVSEDIVGGT
jgi:hypothetical protein